MARPNQSRLWCLVMLMLRGTPNEKVKAIWLHRKAAQESVRHGGSGHGQGVMTLCMTCGILLAFLTLWLCHVLPGVLWPIMGCEGTSCEVPRAYKYILV